MAFQLKNIQQKEQKGRNSFDIDNFLKKEINLFGNRFSNKKKEGFYIELSVLLNAGLELKNALELIGAEQKKSQIKIFFMLLLKI